MRDDLYEAIFRATEALETPVVLAAVAALAWVVVELGTFAAEVLRRLRRRVSVLDDAVAGARKAAAEGDGTSARTALARAGLSPVMRVALDGLGETMTSGAAEREPRVAKLLADFDFRMQRRLGRTRLLVRLGPSLGLMGTLIPLSPALEGLAGGDVETLSENLRLAFSVTVLGILVGVVAFAISLYRDRMYGQDYSDLEYVAVLLDASPEADPA